MMKRLVGLFVLVVTFIWFFSVSPGLSVQRSNFLVIMLDDLEVDLLNNAVENGIMPNFKKYFFDQGFEFTNFFSTTPVCAPSRASLLTGQYSHNHGVLTNDGRNGGIKRLDQNNTLPVWLQDSGYITAHIGKYINGYGTETNPTFIPPGWSQWAGLVDPSTYRMFDFTINRNGLLVDFFNGEYQTNVLSSLAIEFLQKNSTERPFYLEVMPLAPHTESLDIISIPGCRVQGPQQWGELIRPDPEIEDKHPEIASFLENIPLFTSEKPSFNEADISDKPTWFQSYLLPMSSSDIACLALQHQYRMASLVSIDDMIGDLFETLSAKSLLDKTIVIFTSDNGFFQGEHRLSGKLLGYTESIHVPLYIWFDQQTTHQKIDHFINNLDLPVTIADMARVEVGLEVDGKSFKSIIQGVTSPSWRKVFLIENHFDLGGQLISYFGLRNEDTMFLEWDISSTPDELYDLLRDPFELENQATNKMDLVKKLRRLTQRVSTCQGSDCFLTQLP